jgi:DNA-binding response OmpR family regulator
VVLAPTAEEGLRSARRLNPDVILLDFQTSHADAHASIKTISHDEQLKNIPLFILAPRLVIDKLDSRTAHLKKFIAKPVNYVELLGNLRNSVQILRSRNKAGGR